MMLISRLHVILALGLGFLLVKECSAAPTAQKCTKQTMKVRREWSSLAKTERKAYTAAVTCLSKLPSKIPPGLAPGAKSRYDDFTAVHINKTLNVHLSGYFLSWYRNFIHLFEQALVDECRYNGTLPYWNWPIYTSHGQTLEDSALFDGSPASLGGNGIRNASEGNITVGPGAVLPHGTGGGCIKKSPFADFIAPFQHFSFADIFAFNGTIPPGALSAAPHCLQRDLNDYVAHTYNNASAVHYLIHSSPSISDFQSAMNGVPGTLNLGVHGGGHAAVGSDMFDFFASPSDPAFHLHHAMIDLVWTKWQEKDPATRQHALSGTMTALNVPPSANVTLGDWEDWGVLGKRRKVRELMSVTNGPFCYRYEY